MFQCLVDFQHLCKALCHFIIKFIFGKPVRKRKNGFRKSVLPGTLSSLSSWPRRLQLMLLITCWELSKQPGSKPSLSAPMTINGGSFLVQILHPSSYFLALLLLGSPHSPSILAELLDFTEDRGPQKARDQCLLLWSPAAFKIPWTPKTVCY